MNKLLEVEYKGSTLKGELIKEDDTFLQLKLSSGYNANIKKSEMKIISEKEIKHKQQSLSKIKIDKKLPLVTILHTGGTIASKVDYETGAVSAQIKPEELLNLYPELTHKAQVETKLVGNIFSGDMRIDHWNILLEEVKKAIENGSTGVIISHGTDTIQYTAPALQYGLENLNVPVILVGSQRSSDRPGADGYLNLLGAVTFILENSKLKEAYRRVGVCMHSTSSDDIMNILDSINVKKLHSSRRNAFKQINYDVVAKVKDDSVLIERSELLTKETKEKISFKSYNPKLKIGFFKSHPSLNSEEIKRLDYYDGVVIEGTGLGHLAVDEIDDVTKEHTKNLKTLENLQKTTKVVMGTQCVYGKTDLNVYTYGRKIKKTGVKGDQMNLITETLFSRLAFCLSQKDFNVMWDSNLEGFETIGKDTEFD